jgi:hypothetical protein
MTTVSSNNKANPRVLFWLAWPIFFGVASLMIVGLWHRDNNYGVRPGDYSLRVIDSTEFAKLSPEQTARWDLIPGSDKYAQVVIKNPFVFSHVLGQVLPLILFAIVALIAYLWCHGLPQQCVVTTTAPKTGPVEPIAGEQSHATEPAVGSVLQSASIAPAR